jgi:hypothetical protein
MGVHSEMLLRRAPQATLVRECGQAKNRFANLN